MVWGTCDSSLAVGSMEEEGSELQFKEGKQSEEEGRLFQEEQVQ